MKVAFRNLPCIAAAVLSAPLFSACIFEKYDGPDSSCFPDTQTLSIHVQPVNYLSRAGSNDTKEMIGSLRIIIVNENEVELNRYVDISDQIPGGIPAVSFKYDFLHRTEAGTKKIYFFANEESVTGPLLLQDGAIDPNLTLTQLLDNYEVGYTYLDDLEDTLSSLYFEPNYSADNGSVFLPYTSFYEEIAVAKKEVKEATMYLVPVATKFIFNFTNNRPAGVYLSAISINSVNTSNYVFAHVGEEDMEKTFPNSTEPLYWVDWLGQVSKLSEEESAYYPNMDFNKKYGWIRYYSMPSEEDVVSEYEFMVSASNPVLIPGVENMENEDDNLFTAGPYYLPESRTNLYNEPVPDSGTSDSPDSEPQTVPAQRYTLTLGFSDSIESNITPEFKDVEISNLASLFRNTCVVINIKFSQGDLEIFAQLSPWNVQSAKGWLTEGDKPKL